jgi:hypothetical protein
MVPVPPSKLDDSRVAAWPILKARTKGIEDFPHHVPVPNECKGLTPGMKASLLAQTNHAIRPAP